MKTITLTLAISVLSLTAFAVTPAPAKAKNRNPHVYIMMKHGKLIEVRNGHCKRVKKDITLVNETTIHPNGSMDASSGQNLQLKEGQYVTMDGRIRNLKDMWK